jgi:FkbM family methyltransferase
MISVPDTFSKSFVYLDCGARGEDEHPFVTAFPGSCYLGFEADKAECEALQSRAKPGYTFFPVAVGRKNETLPFYVTSNPACCSFLKPNFDFLDQYQDLAHNFEIRETIKLATVKLDDYLPQAGVANVDFMELDTQGTELDILVGAESLLKESVLGLKIEAEYSHFYVNQPLFADLDVFARSCGFVLFDMSRYHYRRKNSPRRLPTRGQLVYGHAVYLKDYRLLSESSKMEKGIKLCMIADYYGFLDYAYEVALHLSTAQPASSTDRDTTLLAGILKYYETKMLEKNRTQKIMEAAERIGLEKPLQNLVRFFEKVSRLYNETRRVDRPLWMD